MVTIPLPDGATLEGISEGNGERAVVICHPHPAFGGRMDTPLIAQLARGFVDAGFTALRFHFRGIGGSGGKATGGLAEHEDVLAAHRFVAQQHDSIAWVGYSFGALMSLRAMLQVTPHAYVGIAVPTGIIEGRDELPRDPHGLLISGSDDPLCDAALLRTLLPAMTIETIADEAHTFTPAGSARIVSRAVEHVCS